MDAAALSEGAIAQQKLRDVQISERVEFLKRIAAVLREGKSRYAEMITWEMGKPIAEAEAEIEKCAHNCD